MCLLDCLGRGFAHSAIGRGSASACGEPTNGNPVGLTHPLPMHASEQSAEDQDLCFWADDNARLAQRGFWADSYRVPPWDWRNRWFDSEPVPCRDADRPLHRTHGARLLYQRF